MTEDISNEINAVMRELSERVAKPLQSNEFTAQMMAESEGIDYQRVCALLKIAEDAGELTSRKAYDPKSGRIVKAYRKSE